MAHCQSVAELVAYMESTIASIQSKRFLTAKEKKKAVRAVKLEVDRYLPRFYGHGAMPGPPLLGHGGGMSGLEVEPEADDGNPFGEVGAPSVGSSRIHLNTFKYM